MDEQIAYDEDFYGWSRQQAEALRRIAGRQDLPNELDLARVAEEIEDVGNAQRSAVQSYIRLIFVHLLKIISVDAEELRAKWEAEIEGFHNDLLTRFSPSMRQVIDVEELWRRAFKQARLDLRSYGQTLTVPATLRCPFELDDFLTQEFDSEAAIARIAARAKERDRNEEGRR